MDALTEAKKLPQQIEDAVSHNHWTRSVAAGSFAASALLLMTGRRKSAIGMAAAGAAVAMLENPEAVRDFWHDIPRYIRSSQDFLIRIEEFIEELNKQGVRLGKVIGVE